jgi:hypothetical protein
VCVYEKSIRFICIYKNILKNWFKDIAQNFSYTIDLDHVILQTKPIVVRHTILVADCTNEDICALPNHLGVLLFSWYHPFSFIQRDGLYKSLKFN